MSGECNLEGQCSKQELETMRGEQRPGVGTWDKAITAPREDNVSQDIR